MTNFVEVRIASKRGRSYHIENRAMYAKGGSNVLEKIVKKLQKYLTKLPENDIQKHEFFLYFSTHRVNFWGK